MGPSSEHRPAGVRPEARPSSSTASGTLKSSILQEDVHTSGAGGGGHRPSWKLQGHMHWAGLPP